jgi:hypothetical protein
MVNFMYNRSWEDIEEMLNKAEQHQNWHYVQLQNTKNKKKRIKHMRNYKALEGVIKSLRWVLGDRKIDNPLE